MRPHEMDIRRAVQDLEENGSSQDPIFYGGKETTPEHLEQDHADRVHFGYGSAAKIRIGYYGGNDLHLIKGGTLSGMVADRRRLRARNEAEEKEAIKVMRQLRRTSHLDNLKKRLEDPGGTLTWWLILISDLIREHGVDKEMHVDAGWSNAELMIDEPI